jgi:hypothetical protein
MIRRDEGSGNCNGDNDWSMNGTTGSADAALDDIDAPDAVAYHVGDEDDLAIAYFAGRTGVLPLRRTVI